MFTRRLGGYGSTFKVFTFTTWQMSQVSVSSTQSQKPFGAHQDGTYLWISIAFMCLSIKATSFPISNKNSLFRKDFARMLKNCTTQSKIIAENVSWALMRPTKNENFFLQHSETFHIWKNSIFVWQTRQHQTNKATKNCHKFCFVSPGGWGTGVSFRFLRFDYGNRVNYLLHLLRDTTTLCASRSRVAARVGDSAIKSQQQIMFHFFMLRLVCSRRKLCETFSFTYGVLHKTYSTRVYIWGW